MKGRICKLLALFLALLISVEGTVAYLSDSDSTVNVMTLGRVKIALIEQERINQTLGDDAANNLQTFKDDHPLVPGVYPAGAVHGSETTFWPGTVKNAVDKIVTVSNTGTSAAYVRLWFAFEVTDDAAFFDSKLHLNKNSDDWQWQFLTEEDGSYTRLRLDNSLYVAAVATYPKVLEKGETTPVSLRQVLLDSGATNEDLAVLGERYSIFVVAQGVQAEGFENAVTALNAGFKAPSAAAHPFSNMTEEQAAFTLDEQSLRDALSKNVPDGGGKAAVSSISFGRVSEYKRDVEELTPSSLDAKASMKNIGRLFFSTAYADEEVPQVYYKPGKNEDGTQYYDVYILYEGTIRLPNNCDGLLTNYENLNSFTTTNLDAKEVKKLENFFKGCTNLTKVTVPQGVTEIDESMFADCSSLEKVSIPGTVEKINVNAFKDHKEDILFIVVEKSPAQNWVEEEDLSSTVVPESPQKPDIPFTWRNDGISITITGYTGKDSQVVIPDMIEGLPVTTIGVKAMDGDDNIITVVLSDTVTDIDYAAFAECDAFATITLTENVTSIVNNAFMGCDSLTQIDVDKNNPVFSSRDGVLFSRDMETLITYPAGKKGTYAVPDSVKIIGEMAFYGCSQLTSIDIPDSVTVIESGAFSGCTQLGSVHLPMKMDKIGSYAFRGCTNLTSVYMPQYAKTLDANLFYLCDRMVAFVYTDSDSHIWCKQNQVGYKLLDGTADHECVMVSNGYQALDKEYHQHIYTCSTCFVKQLVKEQHTFGDDFKCVCGTIDPNHACVYQPLNNYQPVDAFQHKYYLFCTICNEGFANYEKHTYNGKGVCICGATNSPAATPKVTPTPTATIAVTKTPSPDATPSPDVTIIARGVISANNVNFRISPGGQAIKKLAEGTEVEIIEIPDVIDREHWFKVRCEGEIGYIMAPYVEVLTAE